MADTVGESIVREQSRAREILLTALDYHKSSAEVNDELYNILLTIHNRLYGHSRPVALRALAAALKVMEDARGTVEWEMRAP